MQTPKIDKKLQNAISVIILCVIIIFGVFFGIIKPQAQNLKLSNITLAAKERELIAKEKKVKDLKKIENQLEDIKAQSDILIKALPSEKDIPGLLVQIEAIANNFGINLAESEFSLPSSETNSTTPSTNQQTENLGIESGNQTTTSASTSSYKIKELNFPLKISGSYEKSIDFLKTLQNNLRIFKINSLNIEAPSKEETNFSLSVNITTYYIGK